jgi:hypothetical protein
MDEVKLTWDEVAEELRGVIDYYCQEHGEDDTARAALKYALEAIEQARVIDANRQRFHPAT